MQLHLRPLATGTVLAASLFIAPFSWAADAIDKADSAMLKDIAEANMAEVATGKLALEKSASPEVKKFAQMMVDDHTNGLKEAQTLATAKSVDLPDEPNVKHKAAAKQLQALKADTFDSHYIKQAGVGDHKDTVALLKKTQSKAKDADLKALATKMLPIVQEHLKHAQQLATNAKS